MVDIMKKTFVISFYGMSIVLFWSMMDWNLFPLQWRYNGRLKSPGSRLFTQSFIQTQIKEKSKLRVTGLCAGNTPVTGEFPAQMASNSENVSIWWRHHVHLSNEQKCIIGSDYGLQPQTTN